MYFGLIEVVIIAGLLLALLAVLAGVVLLIAWAVRRADNAVRGPAGPAKICPYCKSVIPADAIKCRYCTSEVGPAAG